MITTYSDKKYSAPAARRYRITKLQHLPAAEWGSDGPQPAAWYIIAHPVDGQANEFDYQTIGVSAAAFGKYRLEQELWITSIPQTRHVSFQEPK